MIEECVGLANEWQQLRHQDRGVLGLQHVDVTGAHARKIGHGHLALVGAAFAEQHLSGLEDAGEGHAVGNVAPTADAQVTWFEMFQTDVAFNAIGQRILAACFREAHHVAEFHPTPAGIQGFIVLVRHARCPP
ncbi:hypothetical protein D9M69_528130 [compost metagenome]